MKNKFKFLSLSLTGGKGQFTMMLPFGDTQLALEAAMREAILAEIRLAATKPGEQTESMGVGRASQWGAQPATIHFDTVDELLPKETDYYYKDYRAISATLAPCYGLDFSKPGVLEAAVEKLNGQTVYKDHYFHSVDGWVGVVSEAVWDEKGDNAGGIPGINARLKLDAKKDPMLVRGVAMSPPAVHSCSVTVLFQFDFSHPDLVEQGRFWQLLGEEVEGEIVRLIVTVILGFWEISLVFQGAQEENKQQPTTVPAPAVAETDDKRGAEMSATANTSASSQASREERTTVKLNAQRKQQLGITAEGEDFPDEQVLAIVDGLVSQAAAGAAVTTARRSECLRLATLAECGAADGQLDATLTNIINKSQGEELEGLIKLYAGKADARFPLTCLGCGKQHLSGRSSVEERAGQPEVISQRQVAPTVADSLHG